MYTRINDFEFDRKDNWFYVDDENSILLLYHYCRYIYII